MRGRENVIWLIMANVMRILQRLHIYLMIILMLKHVTQTPPRYTPTYIKNHKHFATLSLLGVLGYNMYCCKTSKSEQNIFC
jgi:hypothetical protein